MVGPSECKDVRGVYRKKRFGSNLDSVFPEKTHVLSVPPSRPSNGRYPPPPPTTDLRLHPVPGREDNVVTDRQWADTLVRKSHPLPDHPKLFKVPPPTSVLFPPQPDPVSLCDYEYPGPARVWVCPSVYVWESDRVVCRLWVEVHRRQLPLYPGPTGLGD